MYSYQSLKNKSFWRNCSSAESDTKSLSRVKFPKTKFSIFERALVKDEFTYISKVAPK